MKVHSNGKQQKPDDCLITTGITYIIIIYESLFGSAAEYSV